MRNLIETAGRRALFTFEPERAHGLSIAALKSGLVPGCAVSDPRLAVQVAGLSFPNPLGMAAGYDKNAEVPDALLRLGFGFAEVGTVTPLAQPGNPRPRIFRLPADQAVINRLGFNNDGHEAALARLRARRQAGIVGVNVGANKDSADRTGDYRLGVERFSQLASYLTVNISSPNTPGLRGLQDPDALGALLATVTQVRAEQVKHPPIFLKIAPDLDDTALAAIAQAVQAARIEGVIVSNTTIERAGLSDPNSSQAGGLSGRPLFRASTIMLARMRKLLGKDMVLIGVGGVDSAETTLEKIRAGADLVQLYTGMIYGGPALPGRILRDLSALAGRQGSNSLTELRDTGIDAWASALA